MKPPEAANEGQPDGIGSVEPAHRRHPKARLFGLLSLLWIFPSAGALTILGLAPAAWMNAGSWIEGLRAVRLEQWIALALLATQAVLVWLAWRYRRPEPVHAAMRRKPITAPEAREPD